MLTSVYKGRASALEFSAGQLTAVYDGGESAKLQVQNSK
jgi:hypothetical protein